MKGPNFRDQIERFREIGIGILGFAVLISLLVVLVVVYVIAEEASWYLPDELVAILAGLIGFYLLLADRKIRKALGEWLRE